jgi:glutamate--cysteine ligase
MSTTSVDLDWLCEVFRAAEKPPSQFRLGLEAEKFGLTRDGKPIPYAGPEGVEGLFASLSARGFEAVRETEGGPVIGLVHGNESITLEPGAQVELSGAPRDDVHELARELRAHLDALEPFAGRHGVYFLHLGFQPLARLAELPEVPKQRYPVMRRFLPTQGARGLDMMQRTATVQWNLDFENEADAMRRLCTLLKLTPLLQAMTLNSPLYEGRPSGRLSERLDVWDHMDPKRSGLLRELWDNPAPRYRDYAAWALRAGMFLFKRGDRLHLNTGQSFEDFYRDGFAGERATLLDWKLHLGTLFPDVRLKTTLEVRGVDSQSPELALSMSALLAGLFYDERALERTVDLLAPVNYEMATDFRRRIQTEGLAARLATRTAREHCLELLELATEGLGRRAERRAHADERPFLAPLRSLVERGITPAEQLLTALAASELPLHRFLPEWARRGVVPP